MRKKNIRNPLVIGLRDIFRLEYWKHNYSSIALLLILCVFVCRGTTDGLWFITFTFFGVVKRFEGYVKYKLPLVPGKNEYESIREFGYAKAFTAIIFPNGIKIHSPGDISSYIISYTLFAIFLLHLYTCIIILFYNIDMLAAEDFMNYINNRLKFFVDNWPSYTRMENGLVEHGYDYRITIIKHVYSISLFSILLLYLSLIFRLYKMTNYSEYGSFIWNNIKNTIKYDKNDKIFSWFKIVSLIFLVLLASYWLFFLIYNALAMPITYPGEEYPRHGRYIWMASYGYRDNVSLFYINYMIPSFSVASFVMISGIAAILVKATKWIVK